MNISSENYNKAMDLLDQIIKKAHKEDLIFKAEAMAKNKASQTVGESWLMFHTKALKEFLSKNVHP